MYLHWKTSSLLCFFIHFQCYSMVFYIIIANIFLRSLDFFHSKMSPTADIRGIYARHFFLDLRRGSFTAYSHANFLKFYQNGTLSGVYLLF